MEEPQLHEDACPLFGRTFIAAKHTGDYEDLEFISRANAQ